MSGPERIAENPAPYDVLAAREALVEAAQLNREAMSYLEAGNFESAWQVATIAKSLATYALALTRWTTS